MKHTAKLFAVAGALALLSACTTTQSQLEGKPFTRVDPKLYPVIVSKVDGKSYLQQPVMVDPGKRVVTVTARPERYGTQSVDRTFTVDVGPCEIIRLGARRESPLMEDFEPVVVEREPKAGCTAKKG
jgi:hypothetical protein